MTIYLTLRSIPELADLPKTERDRVWQLCFRRAEKDKLTQWGTLVNSLFKILFTFAGLFLGWELGLRGWELLAFIIAFATVGFGIGNLFRWQLVVELVRPYIREQLRSRI